MSKNSKLKYWLPAIVCLLCQGLGMGLVGIYGFFVNPLAEEFGVGIATINTGAVFLLVVPAFIAPLVGKLVDRFPIRNIMLIGVFVGMGALVGLSQAPSLGLITACFILYAAGLVMYGPLTNNSLLVKLYQENTGRALAIAAMGVSLATVVIPIWVAWLLESYSWRESLATIAISLYIILSLVIVLGLPKHQTDANSLAGTKSDKSDDKTQLLKSPPFWLIGLAVAITFNVALVMGICYPPHFIDIGFTNTDAALFISGGGAGGIAGKILVASLADKFKSRIRTLAIALLMLQILGLSILMNVSEFYLVLIGVVIAGSGAGGFIPMHPFLNSAYFKADIIGRVNGAQMPFFLPFGLVGAPLAGYTFDVSGHYYVVFFGLIVAILFAIALIILLPPPEKDTGDTIGYPA
ncbi:MAG: MFS transporter [Pseudomonadales bacterium]